MNYTNIKNYYLFMFPMLIRSFSLIGIKVLLQVWLIYYK